MLSIFEKVSGLLPEGGKYLLSIAFKKLDKSFGNFCNVISLKIQQVETENTKISRGIKIIGTNRIMTQIENKYGECCSRTAALTHFITWKIEPKPDINYRRKSLNSPVY